MDSSQSEPRVASYPFNDLCGDVILRTNDNVDFYVYKLFLSIASPFFRQMFQLPDGDRIPPTQNPSTHPLITLDDTSQALHQLLVWCDPRCAPAFNSLHVVELGLELAEKYDMDTVIARIDSTITAIPTWMGKDPLHAFAVGARYHMKNVMQRAARQTLLFPLNADKIATTTALRKVQGSAIHDLCVYHSACGTAARRVFSEIGREQWGPLDHEFDVFGLVFFLRWEPTHENDDAPKHTCGKSIFGDDDEGGGTPVTSWFRNYLETMQERLATAPLTLFEDFRSASSFLSAASLCQVCRVKCHDHLRLFGHALRKDIDKRLSQITFGESS